VADGPYRSIFLFFPSLATRYLLPCRRGGPPHPLLIAGTLRSQGPLPLGARTPFLSRARFARRGPCPWAPAPPGCENKKPFSPTRAVTRGGRKGSRRSAVPPRLRARRPDRCGPGGIRPRDPHTASVMRSHCATGPLALHSSTPLTRRHVGEGYRPGRPRGSRASSALPRHRLAPAAGSLRRGDTRTAPARRRWTKSIRASAQDRTVPFASHRDRLKHSASATDRHERATAP